MKKLKQLLILVIMMLSPILATVPVGAATTIAITSPTAGSTVTGSSFTVSGTATANRSISVKINGAVVGTTTSNGGGNWSLNVTGQTAGAKSIEATASAQFMYTNILNAGDFSASRMSRINTLTNTEESSFSIFAAGAFPITWKPNPSFTKAYGVAPYLNSATVWDMNLVTGAVTTFTLPGTTPRGASIAYNTVGSKVYITDNANALVRVYDTATNIQIGSPITVGTAPHSNIKRPGSDEIWVANSSANTLSVISTVSDTVIQTYSSANSPNGIAFSPNGSIAYVGTGTGSGGINVINAATGTTTNTMAGSSIPELVITNSSGSTLYASHPSTGTVDVFNTASETLTTTITADPGSWGLALNSNNSRLYITNPNLVGSLNGTTILVVDTSNNTVVETLTPGGGAPFFIWASPAESDTDTISFTLSSASLADTGDNLSMLTSLALGLVSSGLIGAAYWRRRRHQQTSQPI